MRRREAGLFLFAAALLGASLLTEKRRDVVAASLDQDAPARGARTVQAVRTVQLQGEMAVLDADAWLERLKSRNMNTGPGGQGLFGGTTWQPPQNPASAMPSKPQTPQFPFRLLGRMTLGGSTVIILSKGEQTYPVKQGDVIEQFRIDRIDDDALQVTYVPNGEGRNFRNEDLYPSLAAAAFPSAPPVPQAVETPPAQLPQQAPASPPTPGAAAAPRAGSVAASAATAATAVNVGNAAANTASNAATGVPLNDMPGVSAPIGGMVISPAPLGSGMLVMPTAPGASMNIQPAPPGAVMVMTAPPPGIVMPGVPATASGSPPAQGSQ